MNKEHCPTPEMHTGEGCRPDKQQELLLRAGLLQGKRALAAWEEWRSYVDIDNIDEGSYRLLPLLYRNLSRLGVKDPVMHKLKGTYRLTWYKNQTLFHHMASLVRSFHACGLETLILKGAALAPLYYNDCGVRPMADFDVLVHTDKVLPAIDLLRKEGWTPKDFEPTERYISLRHSHGFEDEAGREFDLHWHVLSECCQSTADNDFWAGTIPLNINGVSTKALNPADQLLHICVHGMKWESVPTIRWVSDAVVILNSSLSEIDWGRLIEQARKRRLILPVRNALHYLQASLEAPVPLEVLRKIRAMPVSRIESFEYKTKDRPPTLLTDLWQLWCQHSRMTESASFWGRIVRLPGFFQHIWRLKHIWEVPFYMFYRVVKKYGSTRAQ
ncbi:MAG TPA: hypothetical protein ENH07_03955 [Nitrospirae bacterium]|nr:hypothetical protein BMS3Abin08_00564 [bacterium BMS3Abin08]HDO35433.1 hypothetical protein [Nitrospirota bacterium]HDY70893.1 hypothetical protein [Nitrospirota bacterium]